jgi:hypothetical protein
MLEWIEGTWLSQTMVNYQWAFPACETLHFFGLCLLMGSVIVMDMRLLGFARGLSIRAVHQLLPWAWAGFGVNLVTGILFIFTQPAFYYPNTAFRIKLLLIGLAGLNALWFHVAVNRQLDGWTDDIDPPAQAKTIASLSLVLWVSVICFGRFIMYWPPI